MAFINKQLFTPTLLGASVGTYYTVPSNRSTLVTKATFTNTSSGAVSITAHLVPAGGSAGTQNQIIDSFVLDSNETFSSSDIEGQLLPQQTTIQMAADTASAVSVIFSGLEIT